MIVLPNSISMQLIDSTIFLLSAPTLFFLISRLFVMLPKILMNGSEINNQGIAEVCFLSKLMRTSEKPASSKECAK